MKTTVRRSGFTLPEILVTVTIVAVLAAVVVPAVVQQVNKGTAPAANSDINGLRSAISNFATDTRHFPARLDQLTGSTLTAADTDIAGAKFSTDASNFHGPYVSASGEGHAMPSGVLFSNALAILPTTNLLCMQDSVGGAATAVSRAQAAALDTAVDKGNGRGAGFVQWDSTSASTPVVAGSVRVCLLGKS